MALTTRQLSNAGAPLYLPSGSILAGVRITFTLLDFNDQPTGAFDGTTHERVVGVVTATTDAGGLFSVNLWPNDRGDRTTKYACVVDYPGADRFISVVPSGAAALSWIDFKLAGATLTQIQITALDAHIAAAIAAHAASAIAATPSGNLAGTTVEAQLVELDTEKEPADATILKDADIGVAVQAYDADLTTWAGVTPGTGVATALAVAVGTAGAPVVQEGALGTPTSGVTDNLTTTTTTDAITDTDFVDTNLAAEGKRKILWTAVKTYLAGTFAALAGSISQAFAVSQLELGHATDTTLSRVSAGVVAIEGANIVTDASLNGGTLPASVTTLAISGALADNDSDTSGATTAFVQSQIANNNNPTAIAQSINMTAAASASSGIAIADNANIDAGTGNFTPHTENALSDWTPSAVVVLMQKHDGTQHTQTTKQKT